MFCMHAWIHYTLILCLTYPYLPTLPVFPVVSKFFIRSPGLLVRAPNLPGNTYRGLFNFFFIISLFSRDVGNIRKAFGWFSDIVENDILTIQIFLDVSRFLYSGGWQVCITNSELSRSMHAKLMKGPVCKIIVPISEMACSTCLSFEMVVVS